MSDDAPSPVGGEFRLEVVAAPSDVDELGHVSNVVYVRWIQDVAKAHSASVGFDHARYRALGAAFVVHKHVVEYRAPAYTGDRLELITWIEGWSAATSERRTRIVRLADERELARATTTWALVTLDTGRPRRIPPELVEAFRGAGEAITR